MLTPTSELTIGYSLTFRASTSSSIPSIDTKGLSDDEPSSSPTSPPFAHSPGRRRTWQPTSPPSTILTASLTSPSLTIDTPGAPRNSSTVAARSITRTAWSDPTSRKNLSVPRDATRASTSDSVRVGVDVESDSITAVLSSSIEPSSSSSPRPLPFTRVVRGWTGSVCDSIRAHSATRVAYPTSKYASPMGSSSSSVASGETRGGSSSGSRCDDSASSSRVSRSMRPPACSAIARARSLTSLDASTWTSSSPALARMASATAPGTPASNIHPTTFVSRPESPYPSWLTTRLQAARRVRSVRVTSSGSSAASRSRARVRRHPASPDRGRSAIGCEQKKQRVVWCFSTCFDTIEAHSSVEDTDDLRPTSLIRTVPAEGPTGSSP